MDPAPSERPVGAPLDSTALLLDRVRAGDVAAREQLMRRYLPLLRRWATGRLPRHARGLADTDDIVQVSLVRALGRVEAFESRREGAFIAYLRQIVLNAVRDQIRRERRSRDRVPLELAEHAPDLSAIEREVGRETLDRYERSLAELKPLEREAVILRVEMGMSFAEIADALGRPSADATRMMVARALVRLAGTMHEHDSTT